MSLNLRGSAGVGVGPTLGSLTEPIYVPHRGGSYTRPEHTLEGYRASMATGATWLDTDLSLLADGGLAVCHDGTVDRTTNGTGNVNTFTTPAWLKLTVDASTWFGMGFPDSKPLVFDQILAEFGNRVILSVEPKGSEEVQPLLDALARRNIAKGTVWINAFSRAWLAPAVAAGYTCSWNTDDGTTDPATIAAAGIAWVGMPYASATQVRIAALKAAGLKVHVQCDTREQRDIAVGWGANMIVMDAWDYTNKNTALFTSDRFDLQQTLPGMLSYNGTPVFEAPNWCGYATAAPGNHRGWLMGHMSPVANPAGSYSVTGTIRMDSATATDRFGTLMVACPTDHRYIGGAETGSHGYLARIRKDGVLNFYRVADGTGTLIGSYTTSPTAIADGGTATIKITVTPTTVKAERTDVAYSTATITDSTYRGGYILLGMQGVVGKWKGVTVA